MSTSFMDNLYFIGLPSYKQELYDILTVVLACVIIVTNLFVVILSAGAIRKGQTPRNIYVYLCNIAVANILLGAIKLVEDFGRIADNSDVICHFKIGFIIAATLVSVYSITIIAMDRFITIVNERDDFTVRFATFMLLKIWLLASVVGFLPAIGVRHPNESRQFCSLRTLAPTAVVVAIAFMGMLPLLIIVVLYFIMLKYDLVKSQAADLAVPSNINYLDNEIVDGENFNEEKPPIFNCCGITKVIDTSYTAGKSDGRGKRLVLFTAISYCVTWVPYFIALVMYVFCDASETPKYCYDLSAVIENPLDVLSMVYSFFFPFIYIIWHYEYILIGTTQTTDTSTLGERKFSDAERQRGSVTSWISIDLSILLTFCTTAT